jgi:hypothetical protein
MEIYASRKKNEETEPLNESKKRSRRANLAGNFPPVSLNKEM